MTTFEHARWDCKAEEEPPPDMQKATVVAVMRGRSQHAPCPGPELRAGQVNCVNMSRRGVGIRENLRDTARFDKTRRIFENAVGRYDVCPEQ